MKQRKKIDMIFYFFLHDIFNPSPLVEIQMLCISVKNILHKSLRYFVAVLKFLKSKKIL